MNNNFEIKRNQQPLLARAVVRYLPAVLLALLPALAGLSYYFLFLPRLNRLDPGGDLYLPAKQDEYNNYEQYLSRLKNIQSSFEKLQSEADFQKFAFALPAEVDIPDIVVEIEAIAKANGLDLKSLEILDMGDKGGGSPPESKADERRLLPGPPRGVKKVSLNINFGSVNYPIFKNFLVQLEKSARLFDLTSFTYDPKGSGQAMSLLTYYYKE